MHQYKQRVWVIAPIVVILVFALVMFIVGWPKWEYTAPQSWAAGVNNPTILTVEIMGGVGTEAKAKVMYENDDTIQLAGYLRPDHFSFSYSNVALGVPVYVQVTLDQPVNGRQVIDREGNPITQRAD